MSPENGKKDIESLLERIRELEEQAGSYREELRERDKAEASLRASENMFRNIVEGSRDAIFQIDRNYEVTYASPTCADIYGYTAEEFLAEPTLIRQLIHPDYKEQYINFRRFYEETRTFPEDLTTWCLFRKDGGIVYTENTFINLLDENGKIVGFQTTARDVTEKIHAERSMRDSEIMYRTLFEMSPEIVTIIGLDGKVLDINGSYGVIRNIAREDLIGRHFAELELLSEDELPKYLDMFIEMVNGRDLGTLEVEVMDDSGDARCLEVYISRLERDGQLFAFQVLCRDVTGRKKIEAELREAKQQLEERVRDRTAELQMAKEQLERDFEDIRKAEQALRESEDRYRRLFNMAPEAIVIFTAAGVLIEANPAHEKLTGFTREELLGKHYSDLPTLESADSERHGEIFKRMVAGESVSPVETVMRHRDGRKLWVSIHISRLEKDGELMAFQMIVNDMTQRKAAEQALRESEEKYRRLVENLQHEYFFYSHNTDGVMTFISRSVTKVLGYTQEEFKSHYSMSMTGNPVNEKAHEHTQKALNGEQQPPYEVEVYHRNGQVRVLEVSEAPVFGDSGKVIAVEGLARDITAQKMAEEALRESEERFRRLAENSQDIIGRWSPDKGIEYINPAIETITGYTQADCIGKHGFLMTILHPEDIPAMADALRETGGLISISRRVEARVFTSDGSVIWTEVQTVPIYDENGLATGLEFIARDITERKKADEIIENEKRVLEQVIDLNPYAIMLLDTEGRILRFNQAMIDLFGIVPPEDYCVFKDPVVKKKGLIPFLEKAMNGEIVKVPETEYHSRMFMPEAPDSTVRIRTVAFPVLGIDGKMESLVVMHEDVTQRRRTERKKRCSPATAVPVPEDGGGGDAGRRDVT